MLLKEPLDFALDFIKSVNDAIKLEAPGKALSRTQCYYRSCILDTLFLMLPYFLERNNCTICGRLHRLHDTKKEVHVYDYTDFTVPMLDRISQQHFKNKELI